MSATVTEKAAFDQAQQLDHGWVSVEHVLLAFLATPNAASDALADVGVKYERVRDHLSSLSHRRASACHGKTLTLVPSKP